MPVKVTEFVASNPTVRPAKAGAALYGIARQQGDRRGKAGTSHARITD
jgi:hypothetical protein